MQVEQAKSAIKGGSDRSEECYKAALAHPDVAPIRAKINLDGPASLAQMHDASHATKQEIEALLKFDAIRRPCREIAVNAFRDNAPLYVPIFLDWYRSGDAVALQLIDKKITWGQAIQAWQSGSTDFKTKMANMDAFYSQQIAQAQQAEIQQRQQVAESLERWSQNQQAIAAMNRAQTTNCNYIGNSISCTSF